MAAVLQTMHYAAGGAFEPAPDLLRDLLQKATEKVVIVQTGFSTNLAALLESPEDIALVREKVALVVAMAVETFRTAPLNSTCVLMLCPRKLFSSDGRRRLSSAGLKSAAS